MSSPQDLHKRLVGVEKQNIEILETVGEHDKKLKALQTSVKDGLASVNERLAPVKFVWKAGAVVVTLLTIIATLISIGVGFFVYEYVQTKITASVGPLSTKVESLEKGIREGKPTSQQIEDLQASLESVRKSLDEKIQSTGDKINKRVDDYLIGIAKEPAKFKRSYAHAVSVKRTNLERSLPVAQELLVRAREEGTVLPYKDIRRFAQLTLPLLEEKPKDRGKTHDEVWRTLRALASYKSFVDGKVNPVRESKASPCTGGQIDLGGRTALENKVFVNCKIHYQGGDIILENVRFINTEFEMVDEPQARLFLTKFLLSDKAAFSLNTFKPPHESD